MNKFEFEMALDRTIPRKPILLEGIGKCCPICFGIIKSIMWNFCPFCGYTIDWKSYEKDFYS